MSKYPQLWQEINCPNGADMDIWGDALLYWGQVFTCPVCAEQHEAKPTFIDTFIVMREDIPLWVIPMPENAKALAALREVAPD